MTDRELLALAAKAAGGYVSFGPHTGKSYWEDTAIEWNPLTDDGDALRLAVKLGIDQHHYSTQVSCDADGEAIVFEQYGDDKNAATRRAIVRVAAAIGKVRP